MQSQTPGIYTLALKRLLGYLQSEIAAIDSGSLHGGKIYLRDFFAYHTVHWRRISNVIPTIEKHESVLSMKPQLLGAYMKLALMVSEDLESPTAHIKFYDNDKVDSRKKIEDAQDKCQRYLEVVLSKRESMKQRNAYQKWEQSKRGIAKHQREMDSEWLDIRVPDTLYRLADGEDLTLSINVLHEMNKFVPLTLASRAGNRPELIGAMTRGQFLSALKDCSNPNKPVNLDPRAVQEQVTKRMHGGQYINPDPQKLDVMDPEPDRNSDAWPLLKGYAVRAPLHKTGHRYDAWVFLNENDHFLVEMYIAITDHMLKGRGVILNANSAVFVNTDGQLLITKARTFKLNTFRKVTS